MRINTWMVLVQLWMRTCINFTSVKKRNTTKNEKNSPLSFYELVVAFPAIYGSSLYKPINKYLSCHMNQTNLLLLMVHLYSILFYHHNIWKPMQILLRLRQTETLSDKNVYHSHCIQPLLWLLCCNSLIKNETVQSYLWTLNKSIDVWLLLWVIHCIAVLAMVLLWSRFCLLNIISRH
jgi:hypothetical protein